MDSPGLILMGLGQESDREGEMGLVDFSRREGSRAACGACAWIAPSGAGFIRDPDGEALAKTAPLGLYFRGQIFGSRYRTHKS